jgi:hypothetical protein
VQLINWVDTNLATTASDNNAVQTKRVHYSSVFGPDVIIVRAFPVAFDQLFKDNDSAISRNTRV